MVVACVKRETETSAVRNETAHSPIIATIAIRGIASIDPRPILVQQRMRSLDGVPRQFASERNVFEHVDVLPSHAKADPASHAEACANTVADAEPDAHADAQKLRSQLHGDRWSLYRHGDLQATRRLVGRRRLVRHVGMLSRLCLCLV